MADNTGHEWAPIERQ